MVGYLVLGVAILLGLILMSKWLSSANPSSILKFLKWAAIIIIVIMLVGIILTRHLGWLLLALPALIPWYYRIKRASTMAKNWGRMSQGSSQTTGSGQISEIDTKYLKMYLMHDTTEMNGDVKLGKFSGQTLMNLEFSDLVELMEEINDDNESVLVLNAYLERYHGESWKEYSHEVDPGNTANQLMTREEALKILGLTQEATSDEIKDAHRRLMSKMHPDKGGSTYLATKINEAKDYLLDG